MVIIPGEQAVVDEVPAIFTLAVAALALQLLGVVVVGQATIIPRVVFLLIILFV
jgi:hypothetical protein